MHEIHVIIHSIFLLSGVSYVTCNAHFGIVTSPINAAAILGPGHKTMTCKTNASVNSLLWTVRSDDRSGAHGDVIRLEFGKTLPYDFAKRGYRVYKGEAGELKLDIPINKLENAAYIYGCRLELKNIDRPKTIIQEAALAILESAPRCKTSWKGVLAERVPIQVHCDVVYSSPFEVQAHWGYTRPLFDQYSKMTNGSSVLNKRTRRWELSMISARHHDGADISCRFTLRVPKWKSQPYVSRNEPDIYKFSQKMEVRHGACESNPCVGGYQCSEWNRSRTNAWKCECPSTEGKDYSLNIHCQPSACFKIHCNNRGRCVDNGDETKWECVCRQGAIGTYCETYVNIAYWRVIEGAPHINSWGPEKAVDGDHSQDAHLGHCYHSTKFNYPWLQLDLGREFVIKFINIYNRQDCCAERFKNVYVYGYSKRFTHRYLCRYFDGYFKASKIYTFCSQSRNMVAQYIKLVLSAKEAHLQVCEIQVYGYAATEDHLPDALTMEKQIGVDKALWNQTLPAPQLIQQKEEVLPKVGNQSAVGVGLSVVIPLAALAVITTSLLIYKKRHQKYRMMVDT